MLKSQQVYTLFLKTTRYSYRPMLQFVFYEDKLRVCFFYQRNRIER